MKFYLILLSFLFTSCLFFKRRSSIDEEKMFIHQVLCPVSVIQSLSSWSDIEDDDPKTPEFICGEIEVPEIYTDRSSTKIKLKYFYLFPKSYPENKVLPAPFVMSQGGPGSSSLSLYLHTRDRFSDIVNEHGLFAFEYRGTKNSSVPLDCLHISYEKCVSFWKKRFDMRGFNSREFAGDVVTLMEMTGIQYYWFYGVSYGTLIGQHLLRHPRSTGLKGVILDSVVPYEAEYWPPQKALWIAAKRLSRLCFSDMDCAAAYPHLSEFHKREEFKKFKMTVLRGKLFSIFDSYDFYQSKDQFFNNVEKILAEDENAEYEHLSKIRDKNDLLFFTVVCNETLIKKPYIDDDVCNEILSNGKVDMTSKPIVNPGVPVLFLSGYYDVRTNSELAENLIEKNNMNYMQNVKLNVGHGVFFKHQNAPGLVSSFLRDPMQNFEFQSETQNWAK
ncbi:MAG: alpha/beta fold hydrolase [Oligoflexales bacterium]